MKKVLIVLIVLMIFTVFAVDCNVTFGYQKAQVLDYKKAPIYIDINIWQDFNNLQIYGNYRNEMYQISLPSYYPVQDYFKVGAILKFNQISFKLEHQCFHPVVCYNYLDGIDGYYTKFEIRLGKDN